MKKVKCVYLHVCFRYWDLENGNTSIFCYHFSSVRSFMHLDIRDCILRNEKMLRGTNGMVSFHMFEIPFYVAGRTESACSGLVYRCGSFYPNYDAII